MLGSALLCSGLLCAQNSDVEPETQSLSEVVIIDSRFDLKRQNSGKVVAKITEEELAKTPGQTLPAVIGRISGIEITGTRGNSGQNLGYYVRGGRNRQVVIMVDGIQMNDPSSIASDFDLRLLPLSRVKSIEIIKGAASTLYGSGAATAVIHIRTKDPADEKIAVQLHSSVGTNRTSEDDYEPAEFQNSVSVSGKLDDFQYQAGFNHRYSDNLSAVSLLSKENPYEEDPFEKYNFHLKAGYEFTEDLSLTVFGNYNEFTSDYDSYDFTDNANELFSEQMRLGSQVEYGYNNGSLKFTGSFSSLERQIKSEFPNSFDSRQFAFDIYNKYRFGDRFYTVVGLNSIISSFNSYAVPFGEEASEQLIFDEKAHFQIIDPYLNMVYISPFGLNLNLGARLNIHSDYGTHWVYNINPSWSIELGEAYLKALVTLSTAYVTPSLYQLYDTTYGNPDLEPEESRTIEGGLEYNAGNFRLSTVYFNRREEQFIDFILTDPETFAYSYRNIPEAFTAQGVEAELSIKLLEKILFSANYTYTEVEERFALRIPEHKFNANFGYTFNKKWNASLLYQFSGERADSFFNSTTAMTERVILEGFGLLDLFLNYRLNRYLRFSGAVTNIFNREYRELYGYATRGRNLRLGLHLSF